MFALECSEFLSEVCWADLQKTEEITFVCVKIDKSLESSSKKLPRESSTTDMFVIMQEEISA